MIVIDKTEVCPHFLVMREADFYVALGLRIAGLRRAGGNTQAIFAQLAGLTRGALASIETGRQQLFVHDLAKIADVLKIEVAQLLPQTGTSGFQTRRIVGASLTAAQKAEIEAIVRMLEGDAA